jgi:hypothetical protein
VDDTLTGVGLVCPYDRKSEVGWRELPVRDSELVGILDRIAAQTAAVKVREAAEVTIIIMFELLLLLL